MVVRKQFRILKVVTLLLISSATSAGSTFEHNHDHHETKAHVHGQADLNLNVQGNFLSVEFAIPAMDALGFEHQPHTAAEKEKLLEIENLFKKAGTLFLPAKEASCKLDLVVVDQPYEATHNHSGSAGHEDHDHKHKHADFSINAKWHCEKVNELRLFRVDVFKHLPNLQMVNVKWIKDGAAGVFTLTAMSNELSFNQ